MVLALYQHNGIPVLRVFGTVYNHIMNANSSLIYHSGVLGLGDVSSSTTACVLYKTFCKQHRLNLSKKDSLFWSTHNHATSDSFSSEGYFLEVIRFPNNEYIPHTSTVKKANLTDSLYLIYLWKEKKVFTDWFIFYSHQFLMFKER